MGFVRDGQGRPLDRCDEPDADQCRERVGDGHLRQNRSHSGGFRSPSPIGIQDQAVDFLGNKGVYGQVGIVIKQNHKVPGVAQAEGYRTVVECLVNTPGSLDCIHHGIRHQNKDKVEIKSEFSRLEDCTDEEHRHEAHRDGKWANHQVDGHSPRCVAIAVAIAFVLELIGHASNVVALEFVKGR